MKRALVRVGKVAGGLLLIGVVTVTALVTWSGKAVDDRRARVYEIAPDSLAPFSAFVDLELGRRIVEVRGGCVECHGPDLGGATVIDDPAMGRLHGPNLTPAALADWSDDEIGRAIRHGIDREGKPLLLMPAQDFVGLSGGDLASVVAYLRTVPAVSKPRGPIELGPLGKVLIATGQIPTFISAEFVDHQKPFTTKPEEAPTPEFGKYLAQACTGCHGPELVGGPIPGAPPDWAPAADLTQRGLGGWSEEGFLQAMRTGVNPRGVKLRAPFPLALTSQMSDMELKALWAFLRTVPGPVDGALSAKLAP